MRRARAWDELGPVSDAALWIFTALVTLFLVAPGQTTLPIAILQYLQWRIDPTIAAVSLLQIVLIGAGMLVTDRYVKLTRVL